MPDAAAYERALGFETRIQENEAERIEEFSAGRAYFNDSFPRVYDLNCLRVEDAVPPRAAAALAAEAEALHAAAGHEHRRVVVADMPLGEKLAPGFRSLGWQVRRFLYMGCQRPSALAPSAEVVPLDEAAHWEAKRWFMAGAPEAYDDDVIEQLLLKDRLKEKAVDFRRFGVRADGKVVSVCELYSDGSTAQVEDVSTWPGYTRRGYARSTVLTAISAARAAGCEFVFLVADADDWPKQLYTRLGFDPVGIAYDFLKSPAAPAAGNPGK